MNRSMQPSSNANKYDILLIYDADSDYYYAQDLLNLLQTKQLSIFDFAKDCPPGPSQREMFASALKVSMYTCIVVTRHFIDNLWMKFNTEMAIQDMLNNTEKQNSIIVVVMDPQLKLFHLPLELQVFSPLLRTERYFLHRFKKAFNGLPFPTQSEQLSDSLNERRLTWNATSPHDSVVTSRHQHQHQHDTVTSQHHFTADDFSSSTSSSSNRHSSTDEIKTNQNEETNKTYVSPPNTSRIPQEHDMSSLHTIPPSSSMHQTLYNSHNNGQQQHHQFNSTRPSFDSSFDIHKSDASTASYKEPSYNLTTGQFTSHHGYFMPSLNREVSRDVQTSTNHNPPSTTIHQAHSNNHHQQPIYRRAPPPLLYPISSSQQPFSMSQSQRFVSNSNNQSAAPHLSEYPNVFSGGTTASSSQLYDVTGKRYEADKELGGGGGCGDGAALQMSVSGSQQSSMALPRQPGPSRLDGYHRSGVVDSVEDIELEISIDGSDAKSSVGSSVSQQQQQQRSRSIFKSITGSLSKKFRKKF